MTRNILRLVMTDDTLNIIEMNIIAFLKKWSLPCSLLFGTVMYLLFGYVPALEPIGNVAGPLLLR